MLCSQTPHPIRQSPPSAVPKPRRRTGATGAWRSGGEVQAAIDPWRVLSLCPSRCPVAVDEPLQNATTGRGAAATGALSPSISTQPD